MAVLDLSQESEALFCLCPPLEMMGGGQVTDVYPVPLSENIHGNGVCVLKNPCSALLMCPP